MVQRRHPDRPERKRSCRLRHLPNELGCEIGDETRIGPFVAGKRRRCNMPANATVTGNPAKPRAAPLLAGRSWKSSKRSLQPTAAPLTPSASAMARTRFGSLSWRLGLDLEM